VPDPAAEARAVVSLIGRSLGFDELPLPVDAPAPPLMDAAEAADWVAGADSFSAPAKLELLAHASRSALPRTVLEPVAVSLVKPQLGEGTQTEVVEELLDRVYASEPGEDPLGRETDGFLPEGDLFLTSLVVDLQLTSISVLPKCEATIRGIGGYPALSLATVVESVRPLDELRGMVDPRAWPRCPIQSVFFKRMDMVLPAAPPAPTLGSPDDGWSATLQEVVDFSYGMDPAGSSLMTTDLDFVYFDTASSVGCTYDLNRSCDGKILVDRGYILVEDLSSRGTRRTTTLKQVYFTDNRRHGSQTCLFWSIAQALVGSSCLSEPHSLSGSTP